MNCKGALWSKRGASLGKTSSAYGCFCTCSQRLHPSILNEVLPGHDDVVFVVTDKMAAGLKITAGQRTMSGQNDDLSGQNFGSAVTLTGHVHVFQINNKKKLFAVFLEILQ